MMASTLQGESSSTRLVVLGLGAGITASIMGFVLFRLGQMSQNTDEEKREDTLHQLTAALHSLAYSSSLRATPLMLPRSRRFSSSGRTPSLSSLNDYASQIHGHTIPAMDSSHPDYHTLADSVHKNMAVLVVDFQPAYWENVANTGEFPDVPKHTEHLLEFARSRLAPPQIVHIRANYSAKFASNFLLLNPEKTLPEDVEACDFAKSRRGEHVVTKPSFDAFHNTSLIKHLKDIGVDHVVVCGLLTSVCVLFTCQSAFAAGMRVTLFESACGDRTRERHMQLIDMYKDYLYTVENDMDKIFSNTTRRLVQTPNGNKMAVELIDEPGLEPAWAS